MTKTKLKWELPNLKGIICIFTFYLLDNNESMAQLVSQKHL